MNLSTSKIKAQYRLDISADMCPTSFAKCKMALARLAPGQTLAITMSRADALGTLPASLAELGCRARHQQWLCDNTLLLLIVETPPAGPSP